MSINRVTASSYDCGSLLLRKLQCVVASVTKGCVRVTLQPFVDEEELKVFALKLLIVFLPV